MILQFLTLLLVPSISLAVDVDLKSVLKKYAKVPELQIEFEKEVKSKALGSAKNSSGVLYLTGKAFRLEEVKPDQTTVIFDGKSLWTLQYPPPEFGNEPEISRSRLSKKNQDQMILASLLKGRFDEVFRVDRKEDSRFYLKLKKANENVTGLQVQVGASDVEQIIWSDDLGNETLFKLSKVTRRERDPSRYQFKPPKGAKVMEL